MCNNEFYEIYEIRALLDLCDMGYLWHMWDLLYLLDMWKNKICEIFVSLPYTVVQDQNRLALKSETEVGIKPQKNDHRKTSKFLIIDLWV